MIRQALLALVPCTLVLAAFAGPACIVPTISQNDAGAAASSTSSDGGTTTSTDGGTTTTTTTTTVTGGSCATLTSSTGTTSLCLTISSCPGLTINSQVFPQCGFRIHGTAIDPECFCQNEYLCPIASPATCAEAASDMTGDVTYDSVCSKAVTGGGCTDLTASSGASAACQECAASCDNVPSCIAACGC